MDFIFAGRSSDTELGTFDSTITAFDLTGVFAGHSVEAMQNPSSAIIGVTTIGDAGGGMFRVSSFFDVFAEISIDLDPFVPGPERVATLSEVPEPSSVLLTLSGLILVAMLRQS